MRLECGARGHGAIDRVALHRLTAPSRRREGWRGDASDVRFAWFRATVEHDFGHATGASAEKIFDAPCTPQRRRFPPLVARRERRNGARAMRMKKMK